jgi:dTDP-4-amino-4,6-dideoxygalactose transaminase
MVTTNSKEIYEKLCLLRSHGITKMNMTSNHGPWYYEMQDLGFNYRLTDIQCSLGITQLDKNKSGVKKRNKIANQYKTKLKGIVKYQDLPEGSYNAHHLFVIEVENRDDLYHQLRTYNIYTQIHYIPVHTLPYYTEIGYSGADLRHAENYYQKCLSLPMYPTLTENEQSFVIQKIIDICKQ